MAEAVNAGDVVNGRYTLIERVDDWGVGETWRADDARFADRPVVVKLLLSGDDALTSVVLTRLEAVRALRHPHVLPMVDHGAWRGREFAVHEHGPLCSLGTWIDEHRAKGALIPLALLRDVIEHVGAALSAGHLDSPPVLHEGVSPACVMLRLGDAAVRARVMDFGIVPLAEPKSVPAGSARGVACMAPEQFQGELSDPRTDVFSLGLLSLELLAALPDPSVVQSEYRGRGDVTEAVWSVMQRALSTAREDRFASVQAFLDALAPAWEQRGERPAAGPVAAEAAPASPAALSAPAALEAAPPPVIAPPSLDQDQPLRYQLHVDDVAPERVAFPSAPVRVDAPAPPRSPTYEMPALPSAPAAFPPPPAAYPMSPGDEGAPGSRTLSFDVATIFPDFAPDARADTLSTMRSNRDPQALMEMTRRYRMQAAAQAAAAPRPPPTSSGFMPAPPMAPPAAPAAPPRAMVKPPAPPPPAPPPSGSRRVVVAVLAMLLSFGAVLGVVWLLFHTRRR
ncbi:MAG: protein kinase [Polyangiales bacterium]